MSTSRRSFLKTIGLHSAALSLIPAFGFKSSDLDPIRIPHFSENGSNEDYWSQIQQSYTAANSLINLNNGGVSPQPKYVQEAFKLYNSISNEAPSYYMWRELEPSRENIREDLSKMLGVSSEEVVINRNTTEALGTVIFGLDLEPGDEIVLSPYDYPNMRNAWEQRKERDGIVLKYVDIELPTNTNEEIIKAFEDQITSKTKLVHITHMVNYNGQILPAKEIAEMAKKKGALVMLDGAHTFAHIPFTLEDIPCDFFGTSLHKWLCAPFGSGMMMIRREQTSKVWPIFPTDALRSDNIRKFEAMGTRSIPTEVAVGQAILFHQNIGTQRKYNRVRELTDYWSTPFRSEERFVHYTPLDRPYGSLYTFGIDGKKSNEISSFLKKKYHIITSPINWRNINGCRISPHVFTSKSQLDRLSEGIYEMIKS